jgi:hypothetical protein
MTGHDLFLLLLGSGIGGCIVGLALNSRYGKTLEMVDGHLKALVAEHDEIVRGLINRIKGMEAEHAALVDHVEAGEVKP